MRLIDLLLILIGGGVLLVAACVLDFIVEGVYGIVLIRDGGIGFPFRFLALGIPLMSSDYFSIVKLLLNWFIWCLVFAPLFYGVRALFRR